MGPLIRLLFVSLLTVPGSAVAAPGPCGTPGLMPGFLPPVGPAEPFSEVRDKDNRNPYSQSLFGEKVSEKLMPNMFEGS